MAPSLKKNPCNTLKKIPGNVALLFPFPWPNREAGDNPHPWPKDINAPSSQHSPRRCGALPGARGTPPLGDPRPRRWSQQGLVEDPGTATAWQGLSCTPGSGHFEPLRSQQLKLWWQGGFLIKVGRGEIPQGEVLLSGLSV